MRIRPVILCGGAGTRLWPLSRSRHPKQFLALFEEQSLLQATAQRVAASETFEPPIVIGNTEHRFLIAEQLRETGIAPQTILLEPVARNSGPAAAASACHLAAEDPEAVLMLLAADHAVAHPDRLVEAAIRGHAAAADGRIVTFGIRPSRAETAYGYILAETGDEVAPGVSAVARFVEKPDPETAERFLRDGRYLWNSGNVLVRASTLLTLFQTHAPEVFDAATTAVDGARRDLDFLRLDAEAFARAPAISIDHAILEKTDLAAVVPCDPGWNDIGSFDALADVLGRDAADNAALGDVALIDTEDSFVISRGPLVTTLGLRGAIVVATPDAVLVTTRAQAQDVKRVVDHLKTQGREEADGHREVHRPWGSYRTLDDGPGFEIKHIRVAPGGRLSLQRHRHRAEHWVVVEGTARVTRGPSTDDLEVVDLAPNQSIDIPLGWVHRLENPTQEPVTIVEVQSGLHLSPDDIERLYDVYGRS